MRFSMLYAATIVAFLPSGHADGQTGFPQQNQTSPATPVGTTEAEMDYRQKIGYMVGMNMGSDLRDGGIDCDLESLFAGIRDAMSGAKPRYDQAELRAASQRFEREMQQKAAGRMANMQEAGKENAKQAEAFLAENRGREGVQTTASGLQFKVIRQGNGASPTLTDTVRCHYRGTLLDGTEFDSSYGGEPAAFPVNRVIPGWTEALQKMRVGDRWQLFVPPNLAYGPNPPGPPIGPNSLLVFEIELLGIQ